jgi:hypothetical protein
MVKRVLFKMKLSLCINKLKITALHYSEKPLRFLHIFDVNKQGYGYRYNTPNLLQLYATITSKRCRNAVTKVA